MCVENEVASFKFCLVQIVAVAESSADDSATVGDDVAMPAPDC